MKKLDGTRYWSRSFSMRGTATTPNSPREIGVGLTSPRAMKPDMASKSNVMQTRCRFSAMSGSSCFPSLFGQYVRLAHQLREFRHLALHERSEFCRAAAFRVESLPGYALAEVVAADNADGSGVEAVHEIGRNGRGREETEPGSEV